MIKQRQYPFTAYVLTPSMNIKEVVLVRASAYTGYHLANGGIAYHDGQIHDTPQAAIEFGRAWLDEQRTKLAKQQANIEKRAANLDKAAAKL